MYNYKLETFFPLKILPNPKKKKMGPEDLVFPKV